MISKIHQTWEINHNTALGSPDVFRIGDPLWLYIEGQEREREIKNTSKTDLLHLTCSDCRVSDDFNKLSIEAKTFTSLFHIAMNSEIWDFAFLKFSINTRLSPSRTKSFIALCFIKKNTLKDGPEFNFQMIRDCFSTSQWCTQDFRLRSEFWEWTQKFYISFGGGPKISCKFWMWLNPSPTRATR